MATTLAGILASFVASHLGGMAIGGVIGRSELFGFGFNALRFAARRRIERKQHQARSDLQQWIEGQEATLSQTGKST